MGCGLSLGTCRIDQVLGVVRFVTYNIVLVPYAPEQFDELAQTLATQERHILVRRAISASCLLVLFQGDRWSDAYFFVLGLLILDSSIWVHADMCVGENII